MSTLRNEKLFFFSCFFIYLVRKFFFCSKRLFYLIFFCNKLFAFIFFIIISSVLYMLVSQKKWLTRRFPFGYYNSCNKSSNHAIRWKKNQKRKSKIWFDKSYNRTKSRFYAFMACRPLAPESATRLMAKDFLAIRSTKPFCQFTLMTRSLVPHIKINKHAFKELSRDGFMVSIKRP